MQYHLQIAAIFHCKNEKSADHHLSIYSRFHCFGHVSNANSGNVGGGNDSHNMQA